LPRTWNKKKQDNIQIEILGLGYGGGKQIKLFQKFVSRKGLAAQVFETHHFYSTD
jgi:hypothetical protein